MSLMDVKQLNIQCQELFQEQFSILQNSLKILPDKPEETEISVLYALWHFAQGKPLSCKAAVEKPLTNLPADKFNVFRDLIQTRISGSPLAYMVGRQHFMGLELVSTPSALIPRKETEQLAEVSLEYIESMTPGQEKIVIIDLFTGSGNLPLCFTNRLSQADVYGADISDDAIHLANINAKKLNLSVIFRAGDMFEPFENDDFFSKVDLISACPPYVIDKNVAEMPDEISNNEPELAFDAGPFGFKFFMRLINESPKFLRKGGWLVFEVGLGQGKGIVKQLEKSKNYDQVKAHQNAEENIRVIAARKR